MILTSVIIAFAKFVIFSPFLVARITSSPFERVFSSKSLKVVVFLPCLIRRVNCGVNFIVFIQIGARDGIRTRDLLLGKETF